MCQVTTNPDLLIFCNVPKFPESSDLMKNLLIFARLCPSVIIGYDDIQHIVTRMHYFTCFRRAFLNPVLNPPDILILEWVLSIPSILVCLLVLQTPTKYVLNFAYPMQEIP